MAFINDGGGIEKHLLDTSSQKKAIHHSYKEISHINNHTKLYNHEQKIFKGIY